jgi:hypothetical protein
MACYQIEGAIASKMSANYPPKNFLTPVCHIAYYNYDTFGWPLTASLSFEKECETFFPLWKRGTRGELGIRILSMKKSRLSSSKTRGDRWQIPTS